MPPCLHGSKVSKASRPQSHPVSPRPPSPKAFQVSQVLKLSKPAVSKSSNHPATKKPHSTQSKIHEKKDSVSFTQLTIGNMLITH